MQEEPTTPSSCDAPESTLEGAKTKKWYHAKLIAVGITPTGYIAIGVVPMGVISIGIVPMGIISIGTVAMGAIAAGFVSMGMLTFGQVSMSLLNGHQGIHNAPTEPSKQIIQEPAHNHHHH